jgi:endonuclease III
MERKYSKEYLSLVIKRLAKRYGEPHTQLRHQDMTQLFVAVFLSPQCTDRQVNNVTKDLFLKYKSFSDYANARPASLRKDLDGLNYYKTKAKNLQRSCRIILDRFGGKVPRTIDELIELPGVGRKVANVVLNEGYGINEGIAVDTHCGRVARRLRLSRYKDPAKVERDLIKLASKDERGMVSNLFIELGREICHARNKECARCVLNDICPSSDLLKDKDL